MMSIATRGNHMVQCPGCKDYDVHASRWTGWFERFTFAAILHRPARCYSCFNRFHVLMFRSVKPRGVRSGKPASRDPMSSKEEKLTA